MPENFRNELDEALPRIQRLAKKTWWKNGGRLRQGEEMVEDLTSEGVAAFLVAMKRYEEECDSTCTPMQYAYRSIRGAMLDFIGRLPSNTKSLDEPIGKNSDGRTRRIDLLASGETNAEEMLIDKEFRHFITKVAADTVRGLRKTQREVIKKLLEGNEREAIADEAGISKGTVSRIKKTMAARVRKRLAETADDETLEELNTPYILILTNEGIARLPDGREAVYFPKYAEFIGWNYTAVRSAIKMHGISSLKNYMGVYKKGSERYKILYLKSAIDRITIDVCRLDTKGIGVLPGGKEVVCLGRYGEFLGINTGTLHEMVNSSKVRPIPGVFGRVPNSRCKEGQTVRVYLREKVDAVIKK